jgi:FkbM family methyltransferase
LIQRHLALHFARRLVGLGRYPGQYFIADRLGRALAPDARPVSGRIGSYRVELYLGDELQRQIYFGLYERPLTRHLRKVLRKGSVFYDIGANVGYFTLLASELVGGEGEVHAFEPVPANSELLARNIEQNNIQNVILNEIAVSNESGTLTLFLPDVAINTGWASIVPSDRRHKELRVTAIALDDYVGQAGVRSPDVIKIDIEGAEPKALAGMGALIQSEGAPDIAVEINSYLLHRSGLDSGAITVPLAQAGYALYRFEEKGLRSYNPELDGETLIDLYASKRSVMGRS